MPCLQGLFIDEVPDGASPEVSERLQAGARPLEQLQLLRVQKTVLLLPTLAGDIVADRLLAAMTPDGVNVVAARPERPAPELLPHRRDAPEDLTGRDALDRRHDPGRAVVGDRLHQEVDVVLIGTDLQERDLVAIADVEADALECRVYRLRDHGPPVLGRADQVVEQRRDVVSLMDMFTHASHDTG
jgi:hypothetical protein